MRRRERSNTEPLRLHALMLLQGASKDSQHHHGDQPAPAALKRPLQAAPRGARQPPSTEQHHAPSGGSRLGAVLLTQTPKSPEQSLSGRHKLHHPPPTHPAYTNLHLLAFTTTPCKEHRPSNLPLP
uniref:Uncharacterized protein n=1 Tax=Chlamydomonas leiostraca TaxID=1034604 RepID=A0A7S0WYH7_9CHLO|mmetsp:Transcript_35188/g.89068  ORF Transcript_35188/g.89068 Transcript_35188/m.89068 type:complete len:126 (+) Transcript_35188:283-660(+)